MLATRCAGLDRGKGKGLIICCLCCLEVPALLPEVLHVQVLGHADFARCPVAVLLGHGQWPYALHGLPLPSGWRPVALSSESLPSCQSS